MKIFKKSFIGLLLGISLTFGSVTVSISHVYASIITGIVSSWKLDGNSKDAVSTNNGTDSSITYSIANGKIVQGAGFGGSSKINVGNSVALQSTTFTYTCWVKPTNFSATVAVNAQNPGGTNYKAWFILTSGLQTMHKEGVAVIGTSNTSLTSGAWNFIGVKYDGTNITFYLKGVPDGTGSSAQTFTYGDMVWGSRGDGNNGLVGAMDNCDVYNRLLSDNEMKEKFNAGMGKQFPFSSFFRGYF